LSNNLNGDIMVKILKVDVEGNITESKKMNLKEMQNWVGGYIQYVPNSLKLGNLNIICNEGGIRLQLPKNKMYPMFLGNIIVEQREAKKLK
jgi:hypothetical protein